jgi:hypothetical protein
MNMYKASGIAKFRLLFGAPITNFCHFQSVMRPELTIYPSIAFHVVMMPPIVLLSSCAVHSRYAEINQV